MEATLLEILDARERRVKKQEQLRTQYQKPLLCFTMNIPGPEKWNRDVSIGFTVGKLLLEKQLEKIVYSESQYDTAGCAAYYVVDMPQEQVKQIAIDIEHTRQIGRLFDMDVLDADGRKIPREELGYPPRKCLICGEDARICGRSRAHGLEALQEKTRGLLCSARHYLAQAIADTACYALNQEVNTTPKPGLVDKNNCGAHKDMQLQHFLNSSRALHPYFVRFAETGLQTWQQEAVETFRRIRTVGMDAEKAMLQATGGVNTHKGAIFTMGLLCAAAGRIAPHQWRVDSLLAECAAMTCGIVAKDFNGITGENATTAGEKLYALYGITGVRGQAEAGFPAVRDVGLPIYHAAIHSGLSENHAGCITLLHLIANTDDTNLIHRSNRVRQLEISQQLHDLLKEDPFPPVHKIQQLDEAFIAENLSPGGSADLLAATYFVKFLCDIALGSEWPV